MIRRASIGIIIIVFIALMGNQIEEAFSAFLFAGIIPGTSIQLPWYIPLLVAPILLYLLYQSLLSLFTKNLPRKTAISRTAVSRSKKRKRSLATFLQNIRTNKHLQRSVLKSKKLIRHWYHTLKPQLQLLQQKLVAFARRLRGSTL